MVKIEYTEDMQYNDDLYGEYKENKEAMEDLFFNIIRQARNKGFSEYATIIDNKENDYVVAEIGKGDNKEFAYYCGQLIEILEDKLNNKPEENTKNKEDKNMMYVLNKTTEYRGLEADFEVEAITCSNNLDELNEIRTVLEEQDKDLWGDVEVEYSIMDLKPIEEVRKEAGFDFDVVLYDILNLGLDVEDQYLADINETNYHLPTDVTLEKDNELILTFKKGNKKRLIIEDME